MKPDHDQWTYRISLDDKIAFQKMFEYYYAGLCVYARRFIKDRNTREDIVQDIFCSIWLNRKKIDNSYPIKNYLITSVKNHCLNYLRDSYTENCEDELSLESIQYSEDNEELLHLHELENLLTDTLSKLPTEYRMAFEMSRLEGKSTGEIAEEMGISVRTVERYRSKAIEILKKELKDYLPLLLVVLCSK